MRGRLRRSRKLRKPGRSQAVKGCPSSSSILSAESWYAFDVTLSSSSVSMQPRRLPPAVGTAAAPPVLLAPMPISMTPLCALSRCDSAGAILHFMVPWSM